MSEKFKKDPFIDIINANYSGSELLQAGIEARAGTTIDQFEVALDGLRDIRARRSNELVDQQQKPESSIFKKLQISLMVGLISVGAAVYLEDVHDAYHPKAGSTVYVQNGDTLDSIAQHYNKEHHITIDLKDTVSKIEMLNPSINPGRLQIGQIVTTPQP